MRVRIAVSQESCIRRLHSDGFPRATKRCASPRTCTSQCTPPCKCPIAPRSSRLRLLVAIDGGQRSLPLCFRRRRTTPTHESLTGEVGVFPNHPVTLLGGRHVDAPSLVILRGRSAAIWCQLWYLRWRSGLVRAFRFRFRGRDGRCSDRLCFRVRFRRRFRFRFRFRF